MWSRYSTLRSLSSIMADTGSFDPFVNQLVRPSFSCLGPCFRGLHLLGNVVKSDNSAWFVTVSIPASQSWVLIQVDHGDDDRLFIRGAWTRVFIIGRIIVHLKLTPELLVFSIKSLNAAWSLPTFQISPRNGCWLRSLVKFRLSWVGLDLPYSLMRRWLWWRGLINYRCLFAIHLPTHIGDLHELPLFPALGLFEVFKIDWWLREGCIVIIQNVKFSRVHESIEAFDIRMSFKLRILLLIRC